MASPSPLAAIEDAVQNTVDRLFRPFRPERWLVLGFAAFLDQCGRSFSGGCQFPSGPSGSGEGSGEGAEAVSAAAGWLGENALLAALIAAGVLALVLALGTLVLWVTSRGRFMYIDNVATGRDDVVRPWREHAGRAGSYFVWVLGIGLGSFVSIVALLVPVVWAVVVLSHDGPRTLPIVALAVAGFLLLAVTLGVSLFLVAMRDFVAPLQWYADLPCGGAITLFGRLVREHPAAFALYFAVKLGFTLLAAVVAALACCLTCCLAALPFIQHVVLQPVFYFDRRWSLEVLHQLGYHPPAAPGAESAPLA